MPTPRLLLFGTPGAGKSSLLGALAQAAATQAPLLKGKLVDVSGELHRLHTSTYVTKMPSTDVMESYDVKLQPSGDGAAATAATLLDCSGKSALEMLKAKEPFAAAQPMAKAILAADAILLLVDVSLQGKQLLGEFQQFGQWLTQLHEVRGQQAAIGDLPVYLVLTKCDTLAKPEDTFSKWVQKIEEAKRQIGAKFREYIQDEGEGFGSLDVKLWATAIKRPALADRPAQLQEPYGVAELFREGLESAADFVARRQTSQSRLYNLVVGMAGLVAVLGLSLAFLVDFQPDTRWTALEERVQTLLPKKDATAVQRLGGTLKKLEDKQKHLGDVESDPEFARLPTESRTSVLHYRDEIDRYLELEKAFKAKVKFPLKAATEQEFQANEKIVSDLALPKEWADTHLGKRVAQVHHEYAAVRNALNEREAWLDEQIKKDNVLLTQGTKLQLKLRENTKLGPQEVELWDIQFRNQIQTRPSALQSDPIPGVSGVTFEFLDKFQAVKDARKKWDAVKVQLKRVADNIDELKAGT